jgi:hypothetical protein
MASSSALAVRPVLYSDVDLSKLVFPSSGRVLKAKAGSAATTVYNVTYDGAPLYVRFPPVLSTIGLRPSQYSNGKYSITVNFTNVDPFAQEVYGGKPTETAEDDPYYGQGMLYNFLQALENKFVDASVKNSSTWLNTPSLSAERARKLWTPVVKPHRNRVSDLVTGEYPPIATLDVNTDGGKFDLFAIDSATKKQVSQNIPDMMAAFKAPVRFRGVFVFNGVFHNPTTTRLSATFSMVYAEIMPQIESAMVKRTVAMEFAPFDDLPDEVAARKFERKNSAPASGAAASMTPFRIMSSAASLVEDDHTDDSDATARAPPPKLAAPAPAKRARHLQ